jgi:hypothetical protein
MRRLSLLLAPILMAQTEPKPLVPEGIHSRAPTAPETICGITAASPQEFEAKVKSSPNAKYNNETDRYVTYEGPMPLTLWAFAKPSNFAYPVATCMRVYVEGGQTFTEREMRCDASREACDRTFLEFRDLDKKVIGN